MGSLKNIKLCKKGNKKYGYNDSACRVFHYFAPYCLIFQQEAKKTTMAFMVRFQYLVIIQIVMNACFRVRADRGVNVGKSKKRYIENVFL